VNEPVVGRWYLNIGVPLHHTQRLYVFKVVHDFVHLTDDPRSLTPGERPRSTVWNLASFRVFFRACEDVSRSHALGPCPRDCAVCFATPIKNSVRRALRAVERERKHHQMLVELRRRVARDRRQRGVQQSAEQIRKVR